MALELEFIVDTEGLQLDEVLPLSDLLELEVLFEETLDFEMVVTVNSRVYTDSTLSGSGTVSDPLAINILGSPKFADTQIQGLKSVTNGGSVADADYNWFKGVYASLVDGSVLSWIKGLVNQVKSLATRVGLLEDKYILKYVVPVDTATIDLTTDKYGNAFNFVEGDEVELIIQVKSFVTGLGRINLRVNNNSSTIYTISNSKLSFLFTGGTSYMSQFTTFVIQPVTDEIQGYLINHSRVDAGTTTNQYYAYHTEGLRASAITSINLFKNGTVDIPAGTIILIKKR